MNLGNIIFRLRKDAGYSQQQFASACGITQTYLSQIETNKKEPHISTMKEICKTFDIPYPILVFLAMEEEDISESKRQIFKIIYPHIKALIVQIFPVAQTVHQNLLLPN